MRRFFILFIVFGICAISSTQLYAQRGLGASSLILDDNSGHTITIQTPTNSPPGNPEYADWQAAGFPSFSWTAPIPPSSGATGGFVYAGPLTPRVSPYPTAPQLLYWVYPGQAAPFGKLDSGGATGAWSYATQAQLSLVAGSGAKNKISKWNTTSGDSIGNSSISDDGSLVSTDEPLNLICTTESGTNLHSDYAFINFIDAVGSNRGGVVGNDLNDLTGDNVYTYNQDINYFNIAACIASLVLAVAAIIAAFLPTELPICIINSIQAVLGVAQAATAIAGYYIADGETRDQLGVAYTSSAGDYAEYLRRAD